MQFVFGKNIGIAVYRVAAQTITSETSTFQLHHPHIMIL